MPFQRLKKVPCIIYSSSTFYKYNNVDSITDFKKKTRCNNSEQSSFQKYDWKYIKGDELIF